MAQNKSNIALLLGDPAGIGPELISKLLNDEMTKKANIVIIGEKQVFENGNSITGISHNIDVVENFDEIDFNKANRFLLDISKGCLLYTSPSPRDVEESRMPSSA